MAFSDAGAISGTRLTMTSKGGFTTKDLPKPSTDNPEEDFFLPGVVSAQPMAAAPTVISAPSSTNNVQHNHQNISKTVVEPDVFFQRQAGFAI